jgi:hypothetical protein
MERLEPPAQWVSIPVQEFERLHGEIKRWQSATAVMHQIDVDMLERLGIAWPPGEPFVSLIEDEIVRLREQAQIREMRIAELDASNERLRADNTFAGDATERLLAGIKHVHSLLSFGFVGEAKQELEALLSGSGGSDRA